MRLIPISALLSAILLAQPASAQEQRGAIEGTVQDAQRAVIPGATVEALNLGQGAAVSTVADAAGTFRFPALAPGYYDVTASMPGFAALKFERVEVLLGQIKRLSFVLDVAALAEEVRVSASSPLVDTRQSARVFSMRQDTIDFLPKGRDFTTLVHQAPGANQEPKLGGISIDGSSASENRFIVNGIETTDLLTGVSGHAVLPEFVDELQVKSSGYTAEYGGSIWRQASPRIGEPLRSRLPTDLVFFAGHLGQFTMVVPSEQLVVVRMGVAHGTSMARDTTLQLTLALVADLLEALH